MKRVAAAVSSLLLIAGCAQPPPQPPSPRVLRDRRPEVLSWTMVATPEARYRAPGQPVSATQPATAPSYDSFPGATVPPLVRPSRPADPTRWAPRADDGWRQADPTDPSSPFDRRFERRNQYDDLRRMDPRLSDPPESIWERDSDPDRK